MMKKVSRLLVVALLVTVSVIFCSSVPAGNASVPEKTVTSATGETPIIANGETQLASKENIKQNASLSYAQLKAIATQIKGSKLTFKERLGLRLFGKKIANKLSGSAKYSGGGKSQIIAAILCWVVGILGIHRFYLGYTWQGIVQLLTLGGCGIWALVDFIRILTGNLQPKDADYDVTF